VELKVAQVTPSTIVVGVGMIEAEVEGTVVHLGAGVVLCLRLKYIGMIFLVALVSCLI
jgi:hypothetical protein